MSTVTVETCNGSILSFEHGTFQSKKAISNFLSNIDKSVEEDDIITIYSTELEAKDECYKMSFNSTFNSVYERYENYYRIDQVDLSEGERIIKEVYSGRDMDFLCRFIWDNRKLFNKGFMETV